MQPAVYREAPIYKGATRRALKWGVPIRVLMVLIGAAFMLGLWGMVAIQVAAVAFSWSVGLFPLGWLAGVMACTYGAIRWMRSVTRDDDQALEQRMRALFLNLRHRHSRSLRQCRSYSAVPLKGASDAWRP